MYTSCFPCALHATSFSFFLIELPWQLYVCLRIAIYESPWLWNVMSPWLFHLHSIQVLSWRLKYSIRICNHNQYDAWISLLNVYIIYLNKVFAVLFDTCSLMIGPCSWKHVGMPSVIIQTCEEERCAFLGWVLWNIYQQCTEWTTQNWIRSDI
jgi:hypothetical protein